MSNIVTIEIDLDSIIMAKDRTETVRVPVSFPPVQRSGIRWIASFAA
jgi:hypothetical protein